MKISYIDVVAISVLILLNYTPILLTFGAPGWAYSLVWVVSPVMLLIFIVRIINSVNRQTAEERK